MTLPCQEKHYIHCMRGGKYDGEQVPAPHVFAEMMKCGQRYVRQGEPYIPDEEHWTNWDVIFNTSEYREAVLYRVDMVAV